jgi:hypothetical protein
MRKTGEAPEIAEDTIAPALTREPKAPAKTNEPVVPVSTQGSAECSLPVIEGMGAREAKTALSNWAKEKFNIVLDRRPALAEVIAECNKLAKTGMDKVAGQ